MAADNSRIPTVQREAEPGCPPSISPAAWLKRLCQKLSQRKSPIEAPAPRMPPPGHETSASTTEPSPAAGPGHGAVLTPPAAGDEKTHAPTEASPSAEAKLQPASSPGKPPESSDKADHPVSQTEKPSDEVGRAATTLQPPSQKPAPPSWQNLPPSQPWCPEEIARLRPELAQIAYKDDLAQTGRGAGEWLVAGATRRGRLHAHAGTHRDDAFAFSSAEAYSILCVADGAGSSKHSRIGSEICCREMVAQLQGTLPASAHSTMGDESESEKERVVRCIGAALKHICQRLRELATAAGCQARDFHSTLLVAVQIENAEGGSIYLAQVGDGGICAMLRTGQIQVLELADSGEYSGQVTCFLPDEAAETKASRLHAFDAREIECLLLCSDGIEDPFYPMQRKARAIFQQLYLGVDESIPDFTQPPQPAPLLQADVASSLLTWLDFRKRGENDDRTLVLLYRPPGTATQQCLHEALHGK